MYTSYSIEKVASSNRREALEAAAQLRVARELGRSQKVDTPAPTGTTIRIPRQRRWLEHAWRGTVLSGR